MAAKSLGNERIFLSRDFSAHEISVNIDRQLQLTKRKIAHRCSRDVRQLLAILYHIPVNDVIVSANHSRSLLWVQVVEWWNVYVRDSDQLFSGRFCVFWTDLMINFEFQLHRLHLLNVVGCEWELNLEVLSEPVWIAALLNYFCFNVTQGTIEWRAYSHKCIRWFKLIDWIPQSHSRFNLNV